MHAPSGGIAGPLLLEDDSTLLVDLILGEGDEVGVVVHYEDAGIHHGGADEGDVVEQVDGLLHAGARIDVAAEACAYALKPVEDSLSGEVLGAVEAHVLEEVREAVLVGSLLDGAHVGRQIELRTFLGESVVTDVVGESVVEFSDTGGRIIGKVGDFLCLSGCGGRDEHCRDQKESFHQYC